MPKRLVLFDIDGTLIATRGHSVRAMHDSYEAVWGRPTAHLDYSMDGKTELGITYELLGLAGVPRQAVTERLHQFWPVYVDTARKALKPEYVTVHPGVRDLVSAVDAHPDMVLGLLTGNIEAGAQVKMEAARLSGFKVGAYGQHHESRADLPAVAVEAAHRVTGQHFSEKEVVILGDTPNDILCGQGLNARAIAVATGKYSSAVLASHKPDYLFETFADVPAVMDAILAA